MDEVTVMEAPETGAELEPAQQPVEQETEESPYSPKSSREYSQWLKTLGADTPEAKRFARLSKDNHARLFELNKLEPRGIDGIREKYALLDSLEHGDLKGVEALAAIQDQIRDFAEVDEALMAGDPKALEGFGEEFNEGLAKLTPHILDRIRESNPEAYSAAILPHLVEAIRNSDLVKSFNSLADVLNEQPPSWLPEDRRPIWAAEQMNRILTHADGMYRWFDAQEKQAKRLKSGESKGRPQGTPTLSDREQQFEKETKDHYWKTNIYPGSDAHAEKRFKELFQPFAKRLRLDPRATASLKQAFVNGVVQKAQSDKAYMAQIGRYRGQRNPDANTVLNFVKVEFDKHAKTVMQDLVNERYGKFLNGAPRTSAPAGAPRTPPAPNGIAIVSIKPKDDEVNWRATTPELRHANKFVLKSGKTVLWRK